MDEQWTSIKLSSYKLQIKTKRAWHQIAIANRKLFALCRMQVGSGMPLDANENLQRFFEQLLFSFVPLQKKGLSTSHVGSTE